MSADVVAGQKESKVILDTNILQYLNGSVFADDLLGYIDELTDANASLNISAISISEILSGCTTKQEQEAFEVLERFSKHTISEEILVVAGKLQNLYKTFGVEESRISLADRIIAATAYVTGSDVLTADVNDFPRPVFREKHEEIFYYRRKNKTNIQVVQVLSPNFALLADS